MRHWFITGVSSGLGRALVEAVAVGGDRVTGTVRSAASKGDVERIAPDRVSAQVCDVSDPAAVQRAVAESIKALGPIDVLVNNAGYSFAGTLEEADLAEIRAQFETNFFGAINLIKTVLPAMRQRRRGHIFNVSSMAGSITPPGIGIYGASKLALESASEALAQEVQPFGVHVTVVVPGAFRTRLGHSRRSAAASVADYAAQNQARNDFLRNYSDSQRGDPAKAAAAIVAVSKASAPPRRLVLGPDAFEGVLAKLNEVAAEMRAWEQLSRGTDLAHS